MTSIAKLAAGITVALAALTPVTADAAWTAGSWHQYAPTGTFYSVQAITGPTNGWLIANGQATALTGPTGGAVTLASITSAALDAFVFAGIDDATFWSIDVAGNNEGPNIGGYQTDKLAEPSGHFAWTDGDAFAYTQWATAEPSNQNNIEDYITLFCNTGNGCRSGNWNDISSGTSAVGTQGSIHYYLAQSLATTPGAVPEPASWALMIAGFGLVGAATRRRAARPQPC